MANKIIHKVFLLASGPAKSALGGPTLGPDQGRLMMDQIFTFFPTFVQHFCNIFAQFDGG